MKIDKWDSGALKNALDDGAKKVLRYVKEQRIIRWTSTMENNYWKLMIQLQWNLPIETPLNSYNLQIKALSYGPDVFFSMYHIIKNLSIATKPRVKPLFCDIYEQRNKTSRPMRCPTGARQDHIFSVYFPNNESTCLLNAFVLQVSYRLWNSGKTGILKRKYHI